MKYIRLFEELQPVIKYYDDGQKMESWFLNGKHHREDGPAVERWLKNGQKFEESWWLNGKYHRENGPAVQYWYPNGQKEGHWFLNGKHHREDGPAYQLWDENGKKLQQAWILNDIQYTREEWLEQLKKIDSEKYE